MKYKTTAIALIILALAFSVNGAGASTVYQAKIDAVHVDLGTGLLDTTGPRTTPPACSVHGWAFDISTMAGQGMLSIALTAMTSGRLVNIRGSGDCGTWGDRETVIAISVH